MDGFQVDIEKIERKISEQRKQLSKIRYEAHRIEQKRHQQKIYRAGQLLEKVGLLDLDQAGMRRLENALRIYRERIKCET